MLGHPTLLKTMSEVKYKSPNMTFQPERNLAENFHREIAHPESNNPIAFEMVPIMPVKPE